MNIHHNHNDSTLLYDKHEEFSIDVVPAGECCVLRC